jgi:hypothetical protein
MLVKRGAIPVILMCNLRKTLSLSRAGTIALCLVSTVKRRTVRRMACCLCSEGVPRLDSDHRHAHRYVVMEVAQ